MSRDIKALISIYTILILVGWNIGLKHEVEKEKIKKLEAAKVRDKYVIDNNLEHTLNILPTEHTLETVKRVIEIYEGIK